MLRDLVAGEIMTFFDDEIQNAQDEFDSKAEQATDESGADKSEKLSAAQRLFWEKARLPGAKSAAPTVVFCVVLTLLCISITGFVVLQLTLGEGWLENALSDDTGVQLTLKAQSKPEVDDEYVNDDGSYTVEGVAEAAGDSVVAITCYKTSDETDSESEDSYTYAGQGSGVIFTSDGYIITNAHVIASADGGITVKTNDGSSYEAKTIGSDEASDIAVLKIAGKFTPIEMGDSSDVKVGEQVVAIGNPGGYAGTVTTGIVSGTDRMVKSESGSRNMSCIQVDAAVNPGSSGGALLNMWGQLIGITSSKLSSSSYDGIGFAISSNAVIPVVEQLIEKGYADGGAKLGISYYAVTEAMSETSGTPAGLYIAAIEEDSDAVNYLAEGDIITALDGEAVSTSDTVLKIMEAKKPGETIDVTYIRTSEDGSYCDPATVTVTLMEDKGEDFVE